MGNFKQGIIKGAEVIKSVEGLYRLQIETEKEDLNILTYLMEEYALSELYNRRVLVSSKLKPIRLHGGESNELFWGRDNFLLSAIQFIN